MDVNKTILIGNLGKDPALHRTHHGEQLLALSVATSTNFVGGDGRNHVKIEWHKVVAWGSKVARLLESLHKGDRVLVEGSLETRSWRGKDGAERVSTSVHATRVIPLTGAADTKDDNRPEPEFEGWTADGC